MSPPAIPREQWAQHPHWKTQTLLLDSHDSFRGWSDWILVRIEALDPEDRERVKHRRRKVPRLATDFRWWMRGMKGHERYEENKLYPYLARRWGASFDRLVDGHRLLDTHKKRVRRAFKQLVPGDSGESVNHDGLLFELRRHKEILLAHLEEEENLVIPMLLELTPAEFQHFVDTPASELLREPVPTPTH